MVFRTYPPTYPPPIHSPLFIGFFDIEWIGGWVHVYKTIKVKVYNTLYINMLYMFNYYRVWGV